MDCIWVNLKNVGPPFFKFISVYIKMSVKQLANDSQLELIPSKIKQNYLKHRDLAPLSWFSNFWFGILTNLTQIEHPLHA